MSDRNIDDHGDILLGIIDNRIVSAYEIHGHYRDRAALPTSDLVDPPVEPPVEGLSEPRLRYREATAKRKGAWITDYPDGMTVTRWDDGTVKVGMWDHRLILVDPKPRNYGAGKSRGGGVIRMRCEPLDGPALDEVTDASPAGA